MSTQESYAQWFGNKIEFDYAESVAGYTMVLIRLVVGYWFLNAGSGKLMASEPFSAAGWLANATGGSPIHGFFVFAANTPWLLEFTNFMIPVGQTLIGLGIILGALTRLAAFFGGFLMVFFYLGNADWGHGLVNGDLFGLLMFLVIGVFAAGRIAGVDAIVEKTDAVRNNQWLKYLLG